MTGRARDTAAYAAPFAAFVAFMAIEKSVFHSQHLYPLRCLAAVAALALFTRPIPPLRAVRPAGSIAVGIAVFAIWIAPDVLFGYRRHWLFDNPVLGAAASTLASGEREGLWFLASRVLGSTLLVPVIEELFWRGWLMRWLVGPDFTKVALGTFTPLAFWGVALLFASEHGSYWEVGLAAGIVYNCWMLRTRSLADCILAHAVTNGALSAYVVFTGAWRYWL
ncbi:MAG TPA: CAAX prenyl protease-related protein [Bryobacteraceae bacterium]|nr:CAAX prenyl protease-related protein [Bryobacteraceae bacterium]